MHGVIGSRLPELRIPAVRRRELRAPAPLSLRRSRPAATSEPRQPRRVEHVQEHQHGSDDEGTATKSRVSHRPTPVVGPQRCDHRELEKPTSRSGTSATGRVLAKPCLPDHLLREVRILLAASKLRDDRRVSTTVDRPGDVPSRRDRAADPKTS